MPGVCAYAQTEEEKMSWTPERPVEPEEECPARCPVCGGEWPEYRVEAPGQGIVGCEQCLTIWRGGRIQ